MQKIDSTRTRMAVGATALALCIALVGCGSGSSSSASEVPSLGGSSTTAKTTSTTVDPEKAAQEFVACLRKQGLTVDDPQVDSNGNVDMRSIFQSANINPGSTEGQKAMEACRSKLDNAGFGPSEEDRAARQEAMLAFTACLRKQGLDVQDVDFSGPGGARPGTPPGGAGTSGSVGAQVPAGASGSSGSSGAGAPGGPQGGPGPMSEADRTTRLAQRLGLDSSDAKVTAAFDACSDELSAIGGPGGGPGGSTTTTTAKG